MAEINTVKSVEKLGRIFELAWKFKLDATMQVGETRFPTYFLGVETDGRFAVLHRETPQTQELLTPGTQMRLEFNFVDRGMLYQYAFETLIVETGTYKLFNAVYGKLPANLQQIAPAEPYAFIPSVENPLYVDFEIKERKFREEIVRIAVDSVQFFTRSRELDAKTMWAGKKLSNSHIVLPSGAAEIEMQLSKREGAGWVTRFSYAEKEELEKVREYVTKQFFETTRAAKLQYEVDPVEALSKKPRQGPNRKIIIYIRDLDTNLALRELLEGRNYKVICSLDPEEALRIIRAEKPGLVLLDVNSPKSSGMEICKELKNTFYTKNIPIIFMSQQFSRKDLPVISRFGAKEIVEKPLFLPEVAYRVDMILRPLQAVEPPPRPESLKRQKPAAATTAVPKRDTSAKTTEQPPAAVTPAAPEQQAASKAEKSRVLLVNKGDEQTARRLSRWVNEHGLELVVVDALPAFRKASAETRAVLGIVNLQDNAVQQTLQQCQDIVSMPVFITDEHLAPGSVRRTNRSTFVIHSVSDNFLIKLESLIRKISPK